MWCETIDLADYVAMAEDIRRQAAACARRGAWSARDCGDRSVTLPPLIDSGEGVRTTRRRGAPSRAAARSAGATRHRISASPPSDAHRRRADGDGGGHGHAGAGRRRRASISGASPGDARALDGIAAALALASSAGPVGGPVRRRRNSLHVTLPTNDAEVGASIPPSGRATPARSIDSGGARSGGATSRRTPVSRPLGAAASDPDSPASQPPVGRPRQRRHSLSEALPAPVTHPFLERLGRRREGADTDGGSSTATSHGDHASWQSAGTRSPGYPSSVANSYSVGTGSGGASSTTTRRSGGSVDGGDRPLWASAWSDHPLDAQHQYVSEPFIDNEKRLRMWLARDLREKLFGAKLDWKKKIFGECPSRRFVVECVIVRPLSYRPV